MEWIHHLSQAAVTWQEQESRLYQALAWALVAVTLEPLCLLSYSRNVCINPEPGVWPAPGPGGAEEATLGCREEGVSQGDA